MFLRGFDYGKTLQKQIDACRRAPSAQQQKKEAALLRGIEKYGKQLLGAVTNPGGGNPGQMKNGAEALVEATELVKQTGTAYVVFAELVARSRKVPVVPGLAGMVDRLLALDSDQKEEQVAMLNWRIVTGNLRPERFLNYLSRRARLSQDSEDWKDYSWGLSQLIKKGTLRPADELTTKAINDLMDNRAKLGERAVSVQLMLVESFVEHREFLEAERLLSEISKSAKHLPDNYIEQVQVLLEKRPETKWELHEMSLVLSLSEYTQGKLSWNQLAGRLKLPARHLVQVVDFLLCQTLMPRDERLSLFTLSKLKTIPNKNARKEALKRWNYAHEEIGARLPAAALEIMGQEVNGDTSTEFDTAAVAGAEQVEQFLEQGTVTPETEDASQEDESVELTESADSETGLDEPGPELESDELDESDEAEADLEEVAAAEAVSPTVEAEMERPATHETLHADLATAIDRDSLRARLTAHFGVPELDLPQAESIEAQITSEAPPAWVAEEAQLWLGEQLVRSGELAGATVYLQQSNVDDPDLAQELASSIQQQMNSNDVPPGLMPVLGRLALVGGDYELAYITLLELEDEGNERTELRRDIQEWILSRSDPTAAMLMVQAQCQRESLDDPTGGFEAATAAALHAHDDASIQSDYQTWLDVVPAGEIHLQQARQASFLASSEGLTALIRPALEHIEPLVTGEAEVDWAEVLDWLTDLRRVLDTTEFEDEPALRAKWTRFYLMCVVKTGEVEQLPDALEAASNQMDPEEALVLVDHLGAEIPHSARATLEYRSLIRQGNWENALELIERESELPLATPSHLSLLYDNLADEQLLPAAQKASNILNLRSDPASQLELIKHLDERCADSVDGQDNNQALRGFLEQTLDELCAQEYEPAQRYKIIAGLNDGDLAGAAKTLLSLAEQGEEETIEQLEEVLNRMLDEEQALHMAQEVAEVVCRYWVEMDPDRSTQALLHTGRALDELPWVMERIEHYGLKLAGAEALRLAAESALASADYEKAVQAAGQLNAAGEIKNALQIYKRVVELQPDNAEAALALISLGLSSDDPDYAQATSQLIHTAQVLLQHDDRLNETLTPLKEELEAILSGKEIDQEAQQLRLILAALMGNHDHVAEIVRNIVSQGDEARDRLLALFDRLAMEDADMPSTLVVAWGRALFTAGRASEALDRLAGLREAVGDYPEYIALLEELKEGAGGAGASMQLGEAYLRVHLWQRSAEEYHSALSSDNSLAEPILIQLRHYAALDPNPMKYPLHLLGLHAVVYTRRSSDWGWALSAMNWLVPRWSAEELYEIAQLLWQQIDDIEIEDEQRIELLVHLFTLANRLGGAVAALDYLINAWELASGPNNDLLDALAEFDRSKLPDEAVLWFKLRRLDLEAAVFVNDHPAVVRASSQLAVLGPKGQQIAEEILDQYSEQAGNPPELVLARLQLIDLSSEVGRDQFITKLFAALEQEMPQDQVQSLIHTVLELAGLGADPQELGLLLLRLFRQLGDEARAWQLALHFAVGQGEATDAALNVMEELAQHEFALASKVALLELRVVRLEFDQAARLLAVCPVDNLADQETTVLNMAEAILAAQASTQARQWLINYYREHDNLELAADHTVWAFAAKELVDHTWLTESNNGNLLYRAGQIAATAGKPQEATQLYQQALVIGVENPEIAAAVNMCLAQYCREASELEQALAHVNAACAIMPQAMAWQARAAELEQALNQKRIAHMQAQPDSLERTLEIARLHRQAKSISEAISVLQDAISRGQDSPMVYLELAECFVLNQDFNIGRMAFTQVIGLPGLSEQPVEAKLRALYGLAEAELSLNHQTEAIRCFEQVLVIKSDYKDTRGRLQQLYTQGASAAKLQSAKAPKEPAAGESKEEILSELLSLLGVEETPGEADENPAGDD